MTTKMHKVRTIDLTPTWKTALHICRAAIENGTPEGRRLAWLELERMAEAADIGVRLSTPPKPVELDENIGSIG